MAKQLDAAIDDFPETTEVKAPDYGALNQVVKSPTEQLISALTSDSKTIQNIYIEQKKGVGNISMVHGNTPNADITKSVKFFAQYKKLTVFLTDSMAISFRDRMFHTDKPDLIQALRENQANNNLYWEGEFPKWFKEKLEEKSRSLTKDPDAYN